MSTETQAARAELAELIRAKGYTLDAQPITRERTGLDKKALHFECAITCSSKPQHGGLRTFYSVGSAIPILWAKEQGDAVRLRVHASVNDWKLLQPMKSPTIHEAKLIESIRAIYRPDVVDVLASLLMDVRGFELGMTFREWWDAEGSDTMSEASAPDALDAYEMIERSARFLNRTAGADLERMCELAGEL